jgi:4-hydroxythreonine-4-phosphate dehydrogenase
MADGPPPVEFVRTDTPTLAVTMGDPGGIGPEIVVQALAATTASTRFIVHGSGSAMHAAAETLGIEPYWWSIDRGSDLLASALAHRVLLIDSDADVRTNRGIPEGDPVRFEHGVHKLNGALSYRWVCDAIDAARLEPGTPGRVDGIVTAPISKSAWHAAGYTRFPGHTELLASRFNARRFVMMFEGPDLRVSLATVHIPLNEIRDVLTIGRVFDAIDLGVQGCRQLGVRDPRVAVCGLNPHAGEDGLLGDEEGRLIRPAIDLARNHGIRVEGPFPGDTIFGRAVSGEFDLVVAMYHDQGLIPVKLLARDRSVNITVGLPSVRTSPDHGTAFDIAGRGVADAGSMAAAIEAAERMLRPVTQNAASD